MDILGIGMPELLFIMLLAIIILGPKNMQKTLREVVQWINEFRQSPTGKALKDVQELPTQLMRDANLEHWQQAANDPRKTAYGTWNRPDARPAPPKSISAEVDANSIAPPGQTPLPDKENDTENSEANSNA